jgi:tripartite-type tricarboxylate transporter receptor subunit TctC
MFPEVPTMIEQGLAGGDLSFKMMLAAPAGTPKAIIDKIAKDVEAILKDPEFDKKSIHSNGYTVLGGTSKDFQDYLNNTRPVLARIVKEAGFTPQ